MLVRLGGWPARKLQGLSCLYPLGSGIRVYPTCLTFTGALDSYPHAYVISTLPAEPSPQLCMPSHFINDKLESRNKSPDTQLLRQQRCSTLPHPLMTAVVLHCASLLQDEEGTCDIWAIFLLDVSEGSVEKMRAKVKPGASHYVPVL